MRAKKIQDNVLSEIPDKSEMPVSDELKKRIGSRLPEGVDISSIGNIDLYEAEMIATEEIVFLTEDDLIEGLEDFELIPLKNDDFSLDKSEKEMSKNSGLRIKTISSAEPSDDISVKPAINDSEDTDEIEINLQGKESADEVPEKSPVDLTGNTQESIDPVTEFSSDSENIPDDKEMPIPDSNIETETELYLDHIADMETAETDLVSDNDKSLSDTKEEFIEAAPGRITENSINIQFEEIFAETDTDEESIPARFQDNLITKNVRFIDDLRVSSNNVTRQGYNEDPLTERLARIIHVSDSPMTVITARSDYYDNHAYILEDTTLYEKSAVAAAESDEIFYGDPDLDFFEHAIVKNDFSRFIQEIDDYYDITGIESESQISEILGLNSEEREIINDELFSGYYSNIDFDSEIDFLNPDLDFINRSYVGSKDVNYLLNNPESLVDEEKMSIEDDITARSAIVFEEDVEDLKLLMERDYGTTAREKIEQDISTDSHLSHDVAEITPVSEHEVIDAAADSSVIIDITDQVIILEDKENIEAFTSRFPDKKEDLAKLLSYLDGLFEKLPEEAVKKFAQSEYFDLYVKVMNEVGA